MTIFGIWKIVRTTIEIQKYNTNVTVNKSMMIFHSLLLTFQSVVTVFTGLVIYIQALYKNRHLIYIIGVVVDLIVQLMICYICLSMGSHVNLREFKMTLDLTTGTPKVMLTRIIESVVISETEIYETIGEKSRSSFESSKNSELKLLTRSQSL